MYIVLTEYEDEKTDYRREGSLVEGEGGAGAELLPAFCGLLGDDGGRMIDVGSQHREGIKRVAVFVRRA